MSLCQIPVLYCSPVFSPRLRLDRLLAPYSPYSSPIFTYLLPLHLPRRLMSPFRQRDIRELLPNRLAQLSPKSLQSQKGSARNLPISHMAFSGLTANGFRESIVCVVTAIRGARGCETELTSRPRTRPRAYWFSPVARDKVFLVYRWGLR